MGIYDYTIYSIIKRNSRIYNNRTALIFENKRISHLQFLEIVDRLASGLQRVGLKKGDRIGILAQNSLEFVYLYGAAAKIGAVIIPINWRLKSEEIEYIVSNGASKILFVGSEFQEMIRPLISKLNFIENWYAMGEADGGFEDFNDLTENKQINDKVTVHPDDEYIIIYTAAVTGKPRGAILTHQNLITANSQQMYYWRLTKEDVHIITVPLFHIAGIGMTLCLIQAGGSNIIIPKFDETLILKHIQENKATIFCEFPPMLKVLLEKAQEGNYDLSSLKKVVGLDHPETIKRLEEMTEATFWTGYGQSETSGVFCFAPYFGRLGSAGIPGFLVEVEIVDDYGNIMGTGKSGEIVVRGPIVFKGYWRLEKENEYTFREGWHHTGDTGYFDEDGYLWYKGRTPTKELIKPGGENVYPAEVEKAILEHPLVEEGVVIGVPDPQWGEAIKAVCVLKKGESMKETDLIEFVSSRIARFKKPKYVVFVSNLPKKENGLIDRDDVKVKYGKA